MNKTFDIERLCALTRDVGVAREDTYLNAPLYYLLTGRNGARVYQGHGSAMVVCEHPHVPERLLVFPELGISDGKLAASVLKQITPPENGVQLARFTREDIEKLQYRLSEQNSSPVEVVREIEETILDWKYPVHILDTGHVASMKGKKLYNVRKEYNKAKDNLITIPLGHQDARRAMLSVLKYWEGSMIFSRKDEGQEGDIDTYYTTLFAMMDEWPEMFDGLVYIKDGRPVGFSVWDDPFVGTSNLLANLCDISVKGQSDFQIVETCKAMAASGIQYMNFGGSELEGLDFFKRKFHPVKSLDIYSAEVVYSPLSDNNICVLTLVPKHANPQ